MEKNIEPGPTAGKKPKKDEEILELAEEVLNSSDDEIIGLDDDAVVTADEDDDVIDLTDVSEPPLTDEDEILDLTDELEQSEEDDDITIAEGDEIMELEDITDVSADTEVAILELDEAIDALAEPKEEILPPGDTPIDSDEAIIDLNDALGEGAADSKPAPSGPAFAIETDTIELTESDREALEQEFGFEAEDEGPPELDADGQEPAEGGMLAGTLDQELADTMTIDQDRGDIFDLTETVGDETDATSPEQPPDDPQEPLELTDEDRATLEEEIGTDTAAEMVADAQNTAEPLPMEEDASAALEEQLQEMPGEPPEPLAGEGLEAELQLDEPLPVSGEMDEGQPEQEPVDEPEIRFDAEELSMADDADQQPVDFGIDPDAPDVLQNSMELADVNGEALQAEIDRDAAEPVEEEILDVGLDDEHPPVPDEPAAAEADASLAVEGLGLTDEPPTKTAEPGIPEPEPYTIESPADAVEEEAPLTAEALTDTDTAADSAFGEPTDKPPSGTTFDSEEDAPADAQIADAGANQMSVDFDHAESFEQADLHKDADPISIRVKEPAVDDHADEDALLGKVFESPADAASPKELEQTVERVVGQMLAEKIEVILTDAIEKAVEKEIGRLKKLLLDDLNQLE